ncbi:ATP synthase subunit c [Caulifigura coniformis]|uniref:ATP synthase subunit c n=1 Tax=Caulifigura coniformis TaxID=2527983 RepID=A0A517SBV8_9PLAN|nr:ATP synthase F0 subunit C [Caulifigura coniformis]QDT53576.1 ATP synthase subunit c [Caulifigura coniformis]
MNAAIRTLVMVFGLSLIASPAFAQEAAAAPLITFSGAIGAGLVVIGAAMGIGKLAAAAFESMARQPEVAGQLFTALIVAAALIEGFTLFAVFVCMQQNPFAK